MKPKFENIVNVKIIRGELFELDFYEDGQVTKTITLNYTEWLALRRTMNALFVTEPK